MGRVITTLKRLQSYEPERQEVRFQVSYGPTEVVGTKKDAITLSKMMCELIRDKVTYIEGPYTSGVEGSHTVFTNRESLQKIVDRNAGKLKDKLQSKLFTRWGKTFG